MRISLVLLTLFAASPAYAAPKPKLAVLEVVPSPKTKGTHAAVIAASTHLSSALRSQVSRDATYAHHVPAKSTDQKLLAYACLSRPPGCWATIITELGADSMIYGVVEKVGDRIHIVVTLQHGGKVQRAVSKIVDLGTDAELLRLLAHEIYLELHGRPVPQTR